MAEVALVKSGLYVLILRFAGLAATERALARASWWIALVAVAAESASLGC